MKEIAQGVAKEYPLIDYRNGFAQFLEQLERSPHTIKNYGSAKEERMRERSFCDSNVVGFHVYCFASVSELSV